MSLADPAAATTAGVEHKCVLLKHDGTKEEVTLDLSISKNAVAQTLGGKGTIVGEWPENEVVILKLLEPPEDAPVNCHKLQPPFDKKEIKGNMLLVRMDEDAHPQDFTLKEYEEFAAMDLPAVHGGGEEEEEQSEDGDEENPWEEITMSEMFPKMKEDFEATNHRPPTEEEEEAIRLDLKLYAMQIKRANDAFFETHGREPTDEEMGDIIANPEKYLPDEDEEEEEEEEVTEGEPPAAEPEHGPRVAKRKGEEDSGKEEDQDDVPPSPTKRERS